VLDDLNRLGIAYRWTTRFLPLDKTQANALLSRYRRQWFAKRKSLGAILKEVMFNEQAAQRVHDVYIGKSNKIQISQRDLQARQPSDLTDHPFRALQEIPN
jgi:hypothetical protein